ncbi:MAG: hypothetical protein JSS34_04005 [Proteobacteria bacterium]|nr:hypothetical protein [Pseudomonadota bacterium]
MKATVFLKDLEKKKVIENLKTLFQRIDRTPESDEFSNLSEEAIMESVIQEIEIQRHS